MIKKNILLATTICTLASSFFNHAMNKKPGKSTQELIEEIRKNTKESCDTIESIGKTTDRITTRLENINDNLKTLIRNMEEIENGTYNQPQKSIDNKTD